MNAMNTAWPAADLPVARILAIRAFLQQELSAQLRDRGACCPRRIDVSTLKRPVERALFFRKALVLGTATLGEHCDIDWRVKPCTRSDSALARRFHQAKPPQIPEDARAPSPGNLTVVDPPQRLQYRFIRIRGHVHPISDADKRADRHNRAVTAPIAMVSSMTSAAIIARQTAPRRMIPLARGHRRIIGAPSPIGP
jgi:hypothetical protein